MRGAGGSEGGAGRFLIGFLMFAGGGYLFLNSIRVGSSFGFGYHLYRFSWGTLTTGMVLIPFIFGIGIIFYNAKNLVGWLLAGGSLIALVFGILQSVHLRLQPMTAFELITILVLVFGGLGLFLSSLRDLGVGSGSP